MKRGGFAAILLLVALALVSAGCGSDSDTTATVTMEEFEKQAEIICNSYESEKEETIVKLQETVRTAPTTEQQDKIILAILRPYEQMIGRLKDLDLPEGQEQKIEAAIESMENAAKEAEADPRRVVTDDALFAKANKQVNALGLEGCSA